MAGCWESTNTSSSATAPMSQQHGPYITGATTPESYRKTNGTRGEKSGSIVCFYVILKKKTEEQEGMFCCWELNIGSSWGWNNVLWAVLLQVICFHFLGKMRYSFFLPSILCYSCGLAVREEDTIQWNNERFLWALNEGHSPYLYSGHFPLTSRSGWEP